MSFLPGYWNYYVKIESAPLLADLFLYSYENKPLDNMIRSGHGRLARSFYLWYFIDIINPGGDNLYAADQICRMVEFLIDNIFVKFGGCLFHQVIGISMGTNCAPLLADLFLYSYEREFLDNMIRGGQRKLARSFNLCY